MTDEHVFHLAAHIDENRLGIGLQEFKSLFGCQMLHGVLQNWICSNQAGCDDRPGTVASLAESEHREQPIPRTK